MYKIITVAYLFCFIQSFGQKEANIWYFGRYAGIDFNQGSPVPLTNSVMDQWEGCASICDTTGKLLFYTEGIRVYNKNHEGMAGGFGLHGEDTSTQSALIVPKPGSNTLYYLFTISYNAQNHGLQYSIVDMSRQNGLGEVILHNIALLQHTTEKLTAYPHHNGKDIWIVTHAWNSTAFHSYLLTQDGLSPMPVISKTGTFHGIVDEENGVFYPNHEQDYIGYMRISPDGSRLAVAIKSRLTFEVFDFNNATGQISNPLTLTDSLFITAYGVEFSPDGTKLYGTTEGTRRLYQWDLLAGTPEKIAGSRIQIATLGLSEENWGGALQLGPDGKIYVAIVQSPFLSVINNPNNAGNDCNFIQKGLALGDRI